MPEYFEISLIASNQFEEQKLKEKFGLRKGQQEYQGMLPFFKGKVVLFTEYFRNGYWESELSVEAKCLFKRTDIIDQIKLLLISVDLLSQDLDFCYAIGNIETNASFLDGIDTFLVPTKEMILKSSLIFIPNHTLNKTEINLYHLIFQSSQVACLFNPASGILFTHDCENYTVI